jgi:hypothetical protein
MPGRVYRNEIRHCVRQLRNMNLGLSVTMPDMMRRNSMKLYAVWTCDCCEGPQMGEFGNKGIAKGEMAKHEECLLHFMIYGKIVEKKQ